MFRQYKEDKNQFAKLLTKYYVCGFIIMTLTQEEQELIKYEEALLQKVKEHLISQINNASKRFAVNSNLARDLTSELVAFTRDEDKAMIASDEAVAHQLSQKSYGDIEVLNKVLDEPYFARIEILEDTYDGNSKTIEYKLGKNSNADCRIIDWRKAPIAKLYYEYKEGDFYNEEILGKERSGEIKLKRSFKIESGILKEINSTSGKFAKTFQGWEKSDNYRPDKKSYQYLPDILALITEEQFKSITTNDKTPVLIQGVAGSGKTAVAIHRLSWLLHKDNSDLNETDLKIILKSPLLQKYVQNTLNEIGHKTVQCNSLANWLAFIIKSINPSLLYDNQLNTPNDSISSTTKRILYSKAMVDIILSSQTKVTSLADCFELLENILINKDLIISNDKTNLINEKQISDCLNRFNQYRDDFCFDLEFWVLGLLIYQKNYPQNFINLIKHLIIDEIQDFSLAELILIFGCLKEKNKVTIVGDVNQSVDADISFPGWNFILEVLNIKSSSEIITLNVSHRSTKQIMRFAESITSNSSNASGREGKEPVFFKCANEQEAVQASIKWLNIAQNKYPNILTAIICKTPSQAKLVYSYLEPTFKSAIKLITTDLDFSDGIIVSDIKNIKGLEFYNVLIWDVSEKNYFDTELDRNLLYVAITRAEQNLGLVCIGKNSCLINSSNLGMLRIFKSE